MLLLLLLLLLLLQLLLLLLPLLLQWKLWQRLLLLLPLALPLLLHVSQVMKVRMEWQQRLHAPKAHHLLPHPMPMSAFLLRAQQLLLRVLRAQQLLLLPHVPPKGAPRMCGATSLNVCDSPRRWKGRAVSRPQASDCSPKKLFPVRDLLF